MKMSPEEVRCLGKQITQLLETERWLISFVEADEEGKAGVYCLAGICTAHEIEVMADCLSSERNDLVKQGKKNFPN